MNMRSHMERLLVPIIVTFVGLLLVGGALVIAAQMVGSGFAQLVLVSFGAATYAAALAFFLVEFFTWYATREETRAHAARTQAALAARPEPIQAEPA